MSKKDPFAPLDEEERQLMEDIENDVFVQVPNVEEVKAALQQAAINTQRKRQNINLRVDPADIAKIKAKAAKGGLPYQTLIAALIHQYANDQITLQI